MSLKGGYQIIDLKLKEFDSSIENTYRFPDLYFDVTHSNAKMIILSGLALDGVKYNDYEVIIYEEIIDDQTCYQCILRRLWDTKNYKCITKYLTIYPDDTVKTHKVEFTYEILPDNSLSLTSTNAVQNKVITTKLNFMEKLENIFGGGGDDDISTESWGEAYGDYRGFCHVEKIGSICRVNLSGFPKAGNFYEVSFGVFSDNVFILGADKYKVAPVPLNVVHFKSGSNTFETIYDCNAIIRNNKLYITFNTTTGSDINITSEGDYITMYFPIYKV